MRLYAFWMPIDIACDSVYITSYVARNFFNKSTQVSHTSEVTNPNEGNFKLYKNV